MPPPINQPQAGTDDTGAAKDKVKGTSFIAYAFYACLIIIVTAIPSLFFWGSKQYDNGVEDCSADKLKIIQGANAYAEREHNERMQIQAKNDSLQGVLNNIYKDETKKQFEIFKMKLNSSEGTKVITIKPQQWKS